MIERLTEAVSSVAELFERRRFNLNLDWIRLEARQAGIDYERLEAFESLIREFYVTQEGNSAAFYGPDTFRSKRDPATCYHNSR